MDSGPAEGAFTISPHDTNAVSPGVRALYVGGTGDITLQAYDSSTDVVFKAVPVGSIIPVRAKYVRNTGTTATLMIGLT